MASTHLFADLEAVEVIRALRARDWPVVTMTEEIDGQMVDSGFRTLVCPYCATLVPESTDDHDFKEMHTSFHEDVFGL